MDTSRMPPIVLSPETPTIPDKLIARRIVVFIPDDPYWLLFTLRQAARLLEQKQEAIINANSEPLSSSLAMADIIKSVGYQ